MADVLGKLKNSFDKSIAAVSIKSNEFVEVTKAKTQIANLQEELDKQEKILGRAVYKQWESKTSEPAAIEEICEEIQKNKSSIYVLMKEIDRMQQENKSILGVETVACPACGSMNKPGAKFCTECGLKFESEDKVKCPHCGSAVKPGARFCAECGGEIEREKVPDHGEAAGPDLVICECGQALPADAKFCGVCGRQL